MRTMRVFFSLDKLENAFEDVVRDWGLTASEREAVRGTALRDWEGERHSRFVAERLTLVLEIDWLLGMRMSSGEVRQWIRRPVAGVFGSSPLESMFGSTDHLRRIRVMLTLENSQ